MRVQTALISVLVLSAELVPITGHAANYSCNNLVPLGQKMICAGFEPNWAVELLCDGGTMTSNFIDAFSGEGIHTTGGVVSFFSESPWDLATSTGISGTVAYTPAACQDESDAIHDFTFSPTGAPGLDAPFFPFCCRLE